MATLLRLYSYLYHAILSVFLLAISALAILSNSHNLNLPMLPWTGESLLHWLLFGSIAGIVILVLAVSGTVRVLFPLWCLAVFLLMVYGFLIRPYTFEGKSEFYAVLWLIAGALGAFLGSLTIFKKPARR